MIRKEKREGGREGRRLLSERETTFHTSENKVEMKVEVEREKRGRQRNFPGIRQEAQATGDHEQLWGC